jgi:hypothetical protein
LVYIISNTEKPLMPTIRYAKVRILLKTKKAKVVKRKPFIVKLIYDTTNYTQPVTLGVDSGYTYIGYSTVTDKKELIAGEVKLLTNISEHIKERAMYRKQRRSRLRYRAPRFDNRGRSDDWLAPSIQHKLDSHIRFIDKLKNILPISKIIVEVANFDIQKIKNPTIEGDQYQDGEQKGFFNLREYLFHRDGHKCQNPNCKNKDTNPILEVHHVGFWKGDRTNRPGNLVTLCSKCHIPKNHKEGYFLHGFNPEIKTFREATFMTTVRWRLKNILNCEHTYGFDTKSKRIVLKLDKTHYNDAFCITGGNAQLRITPVYFEQIRRNNRSLEKFYDAKYTDIRTNTKASGQELFNGRRTRNKTHNEESLHKYRGKKLSKGKRTIRRQRYFCQPNDLVKYQDKVYTVKGTHNKGKRVILKEINISIKVEALIPYEFRKGMVAV